MTDVSACLVTRGDVDLQPVLDSLPQEWEQVVWDNGAKVVKRWNYPSLLWETQSVEDLAVYGRYAAVEHALNDLIYVQDDDVIVSDPQAIVDAWLAECELEVPADGLTIVHEYEGVVCNMPAAHRSQPFYREHALVGYGAVFHRGAPERAFRRYWDSLKTTVEFLPGAVPGRPTTLFERRCDVLFTALTPRVLVDVPIRNLPYYDAPNRSWKQPNHFKERKKMLELALQVRDA